jgi:hypothetical protein
LSLPRSARSIDGTSMLVPKDRIVEVSADDAAAFGHRGWERLSASSQRA